jgi:hypothetical protein
MNVGVDETAGIDIWQRHLAGIDIQKRPIRAPAPVADPTGNVFARFPIGIIQPALIRHRFAAQRVRFSPRAGLTASSYRHLAYRHRSARLDVGTDPQNILRRDVWR